MTCGDDLPDEAGLTMHNALRWAIPLLVAAGVESPRLDAELLLGHVLSRNRAQLLAHRDDVLETDQARRYAALVRRRIAHEPVAYILGHRAFYDVDLLVDRRVLIPRPETEHLVDDALDWARRLGGEARWRVADVGTGSGALAVTLARHLPSARIWAVDRSFEALQVAAANISRYGLGARVLPLCGDLLMPLSGPLDLVVANLPYVRTDEVNDLAADIVAYEPQMALDGGADGLDLIQRLLPQAAERMGVPGLLLLELDPRQADDTADLARRYFPYADVTVLYDYAGHERVVRVALDG
ncbi:MAG: peptide chain release factor N(5)-glutamine methyltransferase [Anaerolineae bacterium]|jgi:release factor glutamine methyltransferase